MMTPHPRTWFPLIVISLSLVLLITVLFLFKPGEVQVVQETTQVSVTAADYQKSVAGVLGHLSENLDKAEDDLVRINLVQSLQNDLLNILVPADYRQVHLEMVIALNLINQGYLSGDHDQVAQGQTKLDLLVSQYDFLK